MKKGLTELVFILDRSGSMHGMENDTIGGFNSMLEKQQKLSGSAYVSTVLFDNEITIVHDRKDISAVRPMTENDYSPRGTTSLLDAIGSTVHHIGNIHRYARHEDVPENTVFVIITDGKENSSRIYTADRVKKMIEKAKNDFNWEFLFLGANIDAVETASHFGIEADHAVTYRSDHIGTRLNYEVVNEAVSSFRSSSSIPHEWKRSIEDDKKRR